MPECHAALATCSATCPDPKITKLNGGTPVTLPSNIPAPSLLRNNSLAMGNTNWPAISAIILTKGNSPPLSSANSSPMARIFLRFNWSIASELS